MPNSVNLTVNFTKPLKKPHFGKGVSALSEGSPASKSGALGKYTKVHAKPMSQGLQRSHDFILQDQSAKLLPKERVCNCLKRRIDKNKPRTVMFNENHKKAHWGNLQRCGSIWSCPVCAKKITESRRSELKNGLANWKQKHSGSVLLLTLTFSHSINQSLRENVLGLRKAMKVFYENHAVRRVFKDLGLAHKIKGFEVTFGSNGWHPHHHVLLLIEQENPDFYIYRDELAELWIKACIRAGLNAPNMKHGLDLRDGGYAEKYVSKWGLEEEITKGHIKRGRKDSVTPFDLLQLSFDDQPIFGKLPSALWQEMAITFKELRQQQLRWDRGLKKLLLIEEKTDEELAEETENESINLRDVDQITFDLLSKYKKRHEFLKWQEADFENGCYGCGETEQNLIALFELYIAELPDEQSEFIHVCKSLV